MFEKIYSVFFWLVRKTSVPKIRIVILGSLLWTCGKHQNKQLLNNIASEKLLDTVIEDSAFIGAVPSSLALSEFYKKYINADGIPVISSEKVPDEALIRARTIVIQLLDKIPAVKEQLCKNGVRVAVMSVNELTTDIPEHSDLNKMFPDTDWNIRARGLGATMARPAASCAEENILCYANDRYRGEDILVHEFAHTIHTMGIAMLDSTFNSSLNEIYNAAKKKGLWNNTYAMTNAGEYFAEGVQCWFNVNMEINLPDGIHNEINTRKELKAYDTLLAGLISKYFHEVDSGMSCHTGK